MKRSKKMLIAIIVIIAAIAVAGGLFLRHIAHRAVPEYEGRAVLQGLNDTVTVYRDKYAVPHIYAGNEIDLYRAVGYCMAQDRLWQMDLLRRVTQGRLSEIFGKDLVDADILFRSLRIRINSEIVMAEMPLEEKQGLEAFADGVNQYIESIGGTLPPEFAILKYRPEKWEPISSLDLIGYMAWDLNSGWKEDIMMHRLKGKVGEAMYREIVPGENAGMSVFPDTASAVIPEFGSAVRRIVAAGDRIQGMGLSVFGASNNWAVSGKKSVTGKPILANDMHLGYTVPGIWYQMHQVVTGKLDVTGVVLPGQPMVIAGHNADIAWGMTNVGADNLDFYLEKINPADSGQYRFKGRWVPFEVRKEVIRIKGGTAIEKNVRYTVHGPVITDVKDTGGLVVSMKWLGNVKSNEWRGVLLMNRARNWADFRKATSYFSAVGQNIAYADKEGNIGLQCSTGIPVRAKGDGSDLLPGWDGEYEWTGTVPFEQLPSVYNPPSGFVRSANNRTVTKSRYYISTWGFAASDRMERIDELLKEKEKLSVEDFCSMQLDTVSPLTKTLKDEVLAQLKGNGSLTAREKEIVSMVEKWNGSLAADSAAGALCEVLYTTMIRNTFSDELGTDLYKDFVLPRAVPVNAMRSIWKTGSKWFDRTDTKDKIESFADIFLMSFREAVALLDEKIGSDAEEWRWGEIHTLTLQHPLGKVKALDLVFGLNRGPYKLGGSHHTIPQFPYKFMEPFAIVWGPSHRHVYDLSDWNRSKTVIPTGNCGVPASGHYCDQSDMFIEGTFHEDFTGEDLVKKSAAYTMILRGNK